MLHPWDLFADNSGDTPIIIYKVGTTVLTGNYVFPVGDTTVTMDATDSAGNKAVQANFTVTVIDTTDPTVVISSTTTTISGPTTFDVDVIFSENVLAFEDTDITVTNGSVTGLTGADDTYVATIAATGGGNVAISIAESVLTDLAGNNNTASNLLPIENTFAEDTQQLITAFQQSRATQLITNQPNLTDLLSGEGSSGVFSIDVTKSLGAFNFATAQGADTTSWFRLSASVAKDDTSNSSYLFGALGSHFKVKPNLLIGGMLEFDHVKQDDDIARIEGRGWLVGPYFVAKHSQQPIYFDGRLLYGQTSNDISPLGTFTDSFDTKRLLAQLKVSGALEYGATTLRPSLQATYTSDNQEAYTDGLGNLIPEQGIELTQAGIGVGP